MQVGNDTSGMNKPADVVNAIHTRPVRSSFAGGHTRLGSDLGPWTNAR
ncbi:hypothetical protein MOQ72_36515 [Saccharopolyspora sp. K220]|nr:hypothetical protein [Saccharopolyspora soli]MCI2422939.1 hypothetical protein [Saccharopolyspora soli]